MSEAEALRWLNSLNDERKKYLKRKMREEGVIKLKKIGKDSKYGVDVVASFLKYSTILWVFFAILATKVAFGSGIEVTLSADERSYFSRRRVCYSSQN